MLRTAFFIPTIKENPRESEVISHRLLLRSGMIRQVASGIYAMLPLGFKVLEKIRAIVKEEMNSACALEMSFPMVQPSEPWIESGRWSVYGKEMLRFKDRLGRDFLLAPTHEEICTTLFSKELHSYKQLPLTCYQIHWKFRDELRPRFGLLRGREFLMKDAYSFDEDEEGLELSYQAMYSAYMGIFSRIGLKFCAVEADTGAIGGSDSHEFMALADIGEDTIVSCTSCSYAANLEKAAFFMPPSSISKNIAYRTISTPGICTIDALTSFLHISKEACIKSVAYRTDAGFVLACVQGDHEVNEAKLCSLLSSGSLELASVEEIEKHFSSIPGYLGPIGISSGVRVIIDASIDASIPYIVGGNVADTHYADVYLHSCCSDGCEYADIRFATTQDSCPHCQSQFEFARGIEIGHIFKLGTKYSQAMNATFLDANGISQYFVMGCYGIGVSRLISAVIEQNHDEAGIIFPEAITPFHITLVPLDNSNEMTSIALDLYDYLKSVGFDVLYDNRDERAGIKLNEADLLGIPVQIILGKKSLERGMVEIKNRKTGQRTEIMLNDFAQQFSTYIEDTFPNLLDS